MGLFGFQSHGVTLYAPYMSVSTEDHPAIVIGLGFVTVLILANVLAIRGYRAICEGQKKGLSLLGTGLLLPIVLETANAFRSIVISGGISGTPRRYQYYYFAPDSNPFWANLWDTFVPSSQFLLVGHVASLVLLILGNAILFDESRSLEN